MQIELRCPYCACRFSAPPDAPMAEVVDRMTEDGPWFALGDGDTFEDMIFAALLTRGKIACPDCRAPVVVSEESLSRFAVQMS